MRITHSKDKRVPRGTLQPLDLGSAGLRSSRRFEERRFLRYESKRSRERMPAAFDQGPSRASPWHKYIRGPLWGGGGRGPLSTAESAELEKHVKNRREGRPEGYVIVQWQRATLREWICRHPREARHFLSSIFKSTPSESRLSERWSIIRHSHRWCNQFKDEYVHVY